MTEPVKLFISYAHADDRFRGQLNVHLSPLLREGIACVWFDRKIAPGSHWEKEISEALAQAEVHLLLVSPDFFASDYCYGREMAVALDRHNKEETNVIPIVVRPVDWKQSKLARLQALPKDAIPISLSDNLDAAWLDVAVGIRATCEKVVQNRGRQAEEARIPSFRFSEMMGAIVDDMEKLFIRDDPNAIAGIPTGLHDLDRITNGLSPGELNLMASAPGMDREGLLAGIANHVATSVGVPVAFVCTHLDPKYIASRIITTASNLSVGRFQRGRMRDEDWDRLTLGLGKTHDAPLQVLAAHGKSVDSVVAELSRLAQKFGALPLIIIDSIGHLAEDKPTVIRRLHAFLNQSQRTIVAGVGLECDPGERPDKRPIISDIGKWAVLDEDIDRILFLYLDQFYHPDTQNPDRAELIIARCRQGMTGTVLLTRDGDQQRFQNYSPSV